MNFDLRTIKGAVLASRVPNLFIIGFAQFSSGMMLVRTGFIESLDVSLFILMGTTMMVAAAGYIINDYYDAKIDMVNRPQNVVVGRSLSRRKAIIFHLTLTTLAIILGLMVSWKLSLVHLASASILWYYSNSLRRLFIGKIVIAILALASVLLVGFLYGIESYRLMAFGVLGSAIVGIRELIKDMENSKGDKAYGVESVSGVWGFKGTKMLIGVILIVGLSLLTMTIVKVGSELMINYYLSLTPVVLWFSILLVQADKQSHYTRLRYLSNFLVLAGMISMYFV